jgi:hypothetical protein
MFLLTVINYGVACGPVLQLADANPRLAYAQSPTRAVGFPLQSLTRPAHYP